MHLPTLLVQAASSMIEEVVVLARGVAYCKAAAERIGDGLAHHLVKLQALTDMEALETSHLQALNDYLLPFLKVLPLQLTLHAAPFT
jgi:hypothetical protein